MLLKRKDEKTMKKIVSILCLVALLMSTMTFGTVFADDAAGISIKYNKYEELNGNKLLYVDVVCEMPELWLNQDDPLGIGLYEYTGQLLQSFNWKIKYDSANMTYVAGKSTASDIASVVNNSASGTMDAIMAANADFNLWYTGSNFTWTLAFLIKATDAANYVPEFELPYGGSSFTIVTQNTPVDTIISNASNSTVYKDTVKEASGNQRPLQLTIAQMKSYNEVNAPATEPKVTSLTTTNESITIPYSVDLTVENAKDYLNGVVIKAIWDSNDKGENGVETLSKEQYDIKAADSTKIVVAYEGKELTIIVNKEDPEVDKIIVEPTTVEIAYVDKDNAADAVKSLIKVYYGKEDGSKGDEITEFDVASKTGSNNTVTVTVAGYAPVDVTYTVGESNEDASEAGITIKFNRYEELNGMKLLYVDVKAHMPELWLESFDELGIGLYTYKGKLLQSFNWKIKYDSTNLQYVAGKSTASDIASVVNNSASGTLDAIMAANADFNLWYTGSNFTWTLAFLVKATDAANYVPEFELPYGGSSFTIVTQDTLVDTIISNAQNSTVYKDTISEASGNQRPLDLTVEQIKSYNQAMGIESPTGITVETQYIAFAYGKMLLNRIS